MATTSPAMFISVKGMTFISYALGDGIEIRCGGKIWSSERIRARRLRKPFAFQMHSDAARECAVFQNSALPGGNEGTHEDEKWAHKNCHGHDNGAQNCELK